ncbi:uncharacterized protein LOC131678354 [Topomyia yanbarensis]|uniref:uncharacterized protein LOC131678354 n=1 Tax=Topomyia yanbarensis TaxID=2498891 RepID=UPI00273CE2D6|nr:uncharacterized protein LOC131678354 [Topomyia yanbarensis]
MGGKRKKKSISPNKTKDSPLEKREKRSSNISNANRSSVHLDGDDRAREQNSNRFSILVCEDDQLSVPPEETPKASTPTVENRTTTANQQPTNDSLVKKHKLPPLVVKNVPLDKLNGTMKAIGVNAEYKLTGVGIKVITKSQVEYSRAKTYLLKAGIEFYTHDVATEKPFKAVIRGLPVMPTEDIYNELRDTHNLQPLAVFAIGRRDPTKRYRDSLYLVQFVKGSVSLHALKAIRSINSVIIDRNCNLKPKCNKCAKHHLTEHCNLQGACAYKCANCSENHMSTDESCPKREEFKEIRKQASSKNQPGRKFNKQPRLHEDDFPKLPEVLPDSQ